MREMATTLKGAKVIDGISGVSVGTLGAGVEDWDPTDNRVDIATFGIKVEE